MSQLKNFKQQLISSGFRGEFSDDYSTRLLNATDNSIYELMPDAVIAPIDADDLELIVKIANYPEFKKLSLTARGGGTGTNGQSLSSGIIIDFSRFMNKILQLNLENSTVTVEPGVILSDLNKFLAQHGLFFAPNVSTADRATIGGMIANDAAGKGSLIYGKTVDSLSSIKFILANGSVIDTHKVKIDQLDEIRKDDVRDLYKNLIELLLPVRDEIKNRFPPLKRQLSGYNIRQCLEGDVFDLTPLIAGSEGTLGFVSQATLKLLPLPKFRALVVVHYPSFLEALRDAENLINYKPLAIEAIDEKVQQSAQTLPNWPMLAKLLNLDDKVYISNFIEFVANDLPTLDKVIKDITEYLNVRNTNKYVVIRENDKINQLWSIRSLAVGLVGKMPGLAKPVAFVEDAIVPPNNLANFVSDLQDILNRDGLNYAMYGHVDVGCIHVRPALNMQDATDRAKIRPITEEMISLLDKYNGILWGEHGKGFRGEFVPDVFGPILYPILCQIKALFDPDNRLNPGKLASLDAKTKLTRIEAVPMRGALDSVISKQAQDEFVGAMLCNGNAACFNKDKANVMCPSYKVTQDRIHSPKGRAMLVKEWLRARDSNNQSTRLIADMAFDALKGCLGCKGCSGKCPTQVSIPDLRSKFLDVYHRVYKRRNLKDFFLGYVENILLIAARFPKLWNFVHSYNLLPKFGMSQIPLFKNPQNLKLQLNNLDIEIYSDPTQVRTMPKNSVIIFADVFTGFLNQEILFSTLGVLKKLGFKPYVIYPSVSGKALIVSGYIKEFRQIIKGINRLLAPVFASNLPIIGLENTITLMFRDEVNKFAKKLDGKILTIAEFLVNQNLSALKLDLVTKYYKLLPHCTEQAILPGEALLWQQIFSKVGLNLEMQNAGCCGMAGHYGYLQEHLNHSKELFMMNWQDSIVKALDNNSQILATGFSCRTQVEKQINQIIYHPIEILGL